MAWWGNDPWGLAILKYCLVQSNLGDQNLNRGPKGLGVPILPTIPLNSPRTKGEPYWIHKIIWYNCTRNKGL